LLPGTDGGFWHCIDRNGRAIPDRFCKSKCPKFEGGSYYTGAIATCKKTGKNADKWIKKKIPFATCTPCSSPPGNKFAIGGDGKWKCSYKSTVKCVVECPARKKNGIKNISLQIYRVNNRSVKNLFRKIDNWKCYLQ